MSEQSTSRHGSATTRKISPLSFSRKSSRSRNSLIISAQEQPMKSMRVSYFILALFSTAAALRSTGAQLVFQVCRETCPDPLRDPAGFAACHARIAECESKLTAYNGYMGQLG